MENSPQFLVKSIEAVVKDLQKSFWIPNLWVYFLIMKEKGEYCFHYLYSSAYLFFLLLKISKIIS